VSRVLLHKALAGNAALCNNRDMTPRKRSRHADEKPLPGQARLPLGVPPNHSVREEYRTCGSDRCPVCPDGPGHGPYRYAVWREGRRVRRKYLGKA